MFDKRASVAEQGGLIQGKSPVTFDTSDPLKLWIVQMGLIIIVTLLLSVVFKKIRQPKVIAEVIGGILLGPTAFGRVPGFSAHIFPKESISYLGLTANIGLCLFLFLVGLEIDGSIIKKNAKQAAAVSLIGLVLPFGLGAALSIPIYNNFIDSSVNFSHFLLFNGVAHAITAFPVLCRILVETRLIETDVGILVLSAGVGNDVVGWILLALSVALANASNGVNAVYILLSCVAFVIFILTAVKRGLVWLADFTGSTENGPSLVFMTVTFLVVFAASFFTDIIGVHAIFGAFLAGLIVPRRGGLAIALTEKIEDLVAVIFLPLYFTLSGLQTNLGLLDNGITWGFTIAIIVVAFSGKFFGCAATARFTGFNWRESSAVGALMSCKGLVELIVLNIGLNAGILSPRVFSMFVLQALVLTFATTPLTLWFYPPEHRGDTRAKPVHQAGNEATGPSNEDEGGVKTRFTVILDKIENLPGIMAVTHLFQGSVEHMSSGSEKGSSLHETQFDAVRLIELTDRTSAVMKSSTIGTLMHNDPLLSVFRMFGELNDVPVTTSLSVVPAENMAHQVSVHASLNSSHLVIVPWLQSSHRLAESTQTFTPFESFFGGGKEKQDTFAVQSQFVRNVFAESTTDVAVFIDSSEHYVPITGQGLTGNKQTHLFLPFIGGPDDRLALDLVVQLCSNPKIHATVVRFTKSSSLNGEVESIAKVDAAHHTGENYGLTVNSISQFPDTVYGAATTQTRMQSDTADNVRWSEYASASKGSDEALTTALARITFSEISTAEPLHALNQQAASLYATMTAQGSRFIVITGRSKRLAVESHTKELATYMGEVEHYKVPSDVRKTLGEVSTSVVSTGGNFGVLVIQASGTH